MQHNHFYIQKKHFSVALGIFPIQLSKTSFTCEVGGENCDLIEACSNQNVILDSGRALIETTKLLHRQLLEAIRPYVFENLSKYGIEGITQEYGIEAVLESIPVYLVEKDQVSRPLYKDYPKGPQVPSDGWNCIDIEIDVLKKWLDEESLDIKLKNDGVLLGMYQGKDSMNSKMQKETDNRMVFLTVDDIQHKLSPKNSSEPLATSRRIFLWVDHIKEAAKDNGCSYESLFFQVLCHEFMHALMDVYSGECLQIDGANGCEKEIYYEYREESLANGLSLYLLKESAYKDQYDKVVNFVLTQPLQYMLGLAYVTPAKFEPALVEWMEQKMGNKSISRDDLYDWMKQACDILKPYAKSVQTPI